MRLLRRLAPVLLATACLWRLAASPASAAEPARKSINLPADTAERSLKKFSDQAGVEIVFATGAATGIRTNAVKGDYMPLDALRLLLAGTGLDATQDRTTGAMLINRSEPSPPPKAEAARAELPPAPRVANPVAPRPPLVAPARTAVPETESTVISLNEFTVTADSERGYLAGNAISGTKTNTALRDLPISISVLTSEMLDDLNTTVPSEALLYSSSVEMSNAGTLGNVQGSPFLSGNTLVRGSGTFFSMRDGFRAYSEPSGVAVQRIEVVKGPAAVLYGITKPGGIVNYITKTPQHGKNSGRASFSYGSYQSTRSTLDLNYGRLLEDKLAVRLSASYNDLATWFRFSKSTELSFMPSLSYRPFKNTEVLLQYEYTERIFPPNNTDYFTRPVAGSLGSAVPYFAYPSSPVDPVAALSPQLSPGLTPRFVFRGYSSVHRVPYKTLIASITQKFGESVSLNLQVSHGRRNNLRTNFNAAAQFTGALVDPAAANLVLPAPRVRKLYEVLEGYNELDNVNLTAIHRRTFKLPLVGDVASKLIVGVSQLEDDFETWRIREYRPGTNTRLNYYFPLAPDAFTGPPPNFPVGELRRDPTQEAAENNDFELGYLAWSGALFDDRVIVNAGVVRSLFTQSRVEPDAAGRLTGGYVNSNRQNSPLVGAIVRPFKWASLYVQSSKSFNPNTSARDGFGNPLPPEQGKGGEFGAKLDPWGGRLTANFALFRTIEDNRLITDPNAPNSDSFYIDSAGVSQPISGPNDPRYDPNLPGQQKSARTAVGEATTDGFEAEIIWSPSRQFQFVAGYTYLDGYVSKDLNTSPATWRGRPIPGNYYHRTTFLGKYQFTTGALKGLDLVLGTHWRSEVFRDAINATIASTTTLVSPVGRYGKPSLDGDFKVGYKTTILERRTSFQFNIKNLYGRDIGVGWQPTTSRAYASEQYYYEIPPSYTVTVGFEF